MIQACIDGGQNWGKENLCGLSVEAEDATDMVSSDPHVNTDGPGGGENGLAEKRLSETGLEGDRSTDLELLSEECLVGWDIGDADSGRVVSPADISSLSGAIACYRKQLFV